ncbi:NAD(P)/FAD-dependent oxidoreductase [Leifsonia bigeumensis]|uniref:NAD(P)/FAD-dependent oxidoreductase n=1 Tax=Leifsonella bigeumensis TaxID=433643 RepID=A0ABP7F916_9MICO
MPIEYSGRGIDADADAARLRAALNAVELPPALTAIAHLTGDLSLVDQSLRGLPDPAEVLPRPHGGMTDDQRAEAIDRAAAAMADFARNGGRSKGGPSDETLRQLLHFITGPIDDAYLPLLLHELGIPYDRSAPSWTQEDFRPKKPLRVLVIGAGMSGIACSHRLAQAGIEHEVFERGDDVGGVWRENTYPGCRLDTINFGYSYSFAQKNDWPHQFSKRDEVLGYFRDVADSIGLRARTRFGAEVTRLQYDESRRLWLVTSSSAQRGVQTDEFDIVISAVGQLNHPSIPEVPGRDSFQGAQVHTGAWDHSLELAGKSVALVGAGASAFQVGPALVDDVAQLTVFQRNAPWMVPTPAYHDPVTEPMQWLLDRVGPYHRWFRFHQLWSNVEGMRRFARVDEEWADDGLSVSELNLRLRQTLSDRMLERYDDRPDLAEYVVPTYPPFSKRVLRDNGEWARMLKHRNTTLVTSGIERLTVDGIVSNDGSTHAVDAIVWATGFDASNFFQPMEIVGAGGVTLQDFWEGEPRAYLGTSYPGFPNFFSIYGPNTNLAVNGSIVLFSECAIDHILMCLRELLEHNATVVEVRNDTFNEYNDMIDAENSLMAWGASSVTSWYKSASGRISQNSPLPTLDYWKMTHNEVTNAYLFR